MRLGHGFDLVALDVDLAGFVLCIRKCAHKAATPIEAIGVDFLLCAGEVGRHFFGVGVEGHKCVEHIGAKSQPFNRSKRLRHVGTDLQESQEICAVDADAAVCATHGKIAAHAVGVVRCSLEVAGKDVLEVLDRDLALRFHAPGKIIARGCVVGIGTVPLGTSGIEVAQHEPRAGRVVHMVGVCLCAKSHSRIEDTVFILHRKIQVIVRDEGAKIGAAHVLFLLAKRIA